MLPRSIALVLLLLSLGPARADEKKPAAPPPKPDAEQLDGAVKVLADAAASYPDRFKALDVLARGGDPARIPALFLAAETAHLPALAVAAGEAANAIDPDAALKAYDKRIGKLKRLPLAQSVRFLGEIRAKGTSARLSVVVKSKNAEAQAEAFYAVVKHKDESLYGHLVTGLKSRKPEVRIPAAICCGLARHKGAADLLLRGLEDTKLHYAFFCAWALGQMRDPGLLGRVVQVTKTRMAGDVGVAKAKALNECAFDDKAHSDALMKLARSSNTQLASAAADALGRIAEGNAAAAETLLQVVLTSRSPLVSHVAVDALGRIGGPEQAAKLYARYQANAGNIPPHCVKALGLLKTKDAASFLLSIAYKNKKSLMKKRAGIAFWQCADRGARDAFRTRLLAATHDKAVENGCLALGFANSKEGFEFAAELLRKLYGKKSQRHVRAALERMTGHRFAPEPAIWKEWWKKNSDYFDRKPQFLDREAWRKKLVESKVAMGISKKTEGAVARGLAWLARHQSLDGRWSGDKFTDRCRLYHNKKCQVGARLGGWDVGMTGIAVLAFYGAGYRPTDGRYKDTVLRAQIYCAARQWADGDFGGQGDLIGGYTRPIAAIAVAEAYGTTKDPEYLERARRSVAHIIRIQYDDAGWRYRLGGQAPGDTSVTGWNAWAIATAKKFGIPVDAMGLEGSNTLIDMFSSRVTQDEEYYNTDPRYFFEVGRGQSFEHFTGYNAREETRPPMTAIGLICKVLMGRKRSHPYCIGAANRLLQTIPEYDENRNQIKYATGAEYPSYYWYYGSLAMYQMGGRFWRKWSRPLLTEGIPNTQITGDECAAGSWESTNLDSIGGRVYTTSMCVLTLETFYRYLPALQIKN
ncbi:MAG: HEAT repeat domain-containing protein [Planctomycetota bacterium]|jgi:HEAT repeat protein